MKSTVGRLILKNDGHNHIFVVIPGQPLLSYSVDSISGDERLEDLYPF